MIRIANEFDGFENDEKSYVFQNFPKSFKDNRGEFMEVMKTEDLKDAPRWFENQKWIRQINRSYSKSGVIRGCHAQKGEFCQGKLVESVKGVIYDLITDCRPESKTFGVSSVFILDPKKHNQLWVPHGFLHCVIIPEVKGEAVLQYFCDNVYDHESEFSVNPKTLVPDVVKELKKLKPKGYEKLFEMFSSKKKAIFSEKDMKGLDYVEFMKKVKNDFRKHGSLWYNI